MYRLIAVVLLFCVLSGCYMNKTLDKPTVILLEYKDAYVDKRAEGNNKYINNYFPENYRDKYAAALIDELESCNLLVTDMPEKADYIIVINKILVKETSSTETVSDETSEFNGMTYVLSDCYVEAEYKIYIGGKKDRLLDSGSVSADKEEKVTNNRNLGDYISGGNKDNSTYRQKELHEDIFITLSEKCGRRTTAQISKRIYKHIKKGR